MRFVAVATIALLVSGVAAFGDFFNAFFDTGGRNQQDEGANAPPRPASSHANSGKITFASCLDLIPKMALVPNTAAQIPRPALKSLLIVRVLR